MMNERRGESEPIGGLRTPDVEMKTTNATLWFGLVPLIEEPCVSQHYDTCDGVLNGAQLHLLPVTAPLPCSHRVSFAKEGLGYPCKGKTTPNRIVP
jgi:hypothetical protein